MISKISRVPYDESSVEKYIDLLNKIGIFKIELIINKDKERYEFSLLSDNYNDRAFWVGAMISIRYLWENSAHDHFYKCPLYFFKLVEKYPEEDLLYLFLWSQCYFDNKYYNTNHALKYSSTYPFKLKHIVINKYYVNKTFSKYTKSEYNKTLEEYKQELENFKLF